MRKCYDDTCKVVTKYKCHSNCCSILICKDINLQLNPYQYYQIYYNALRKLLQSIPKDKNNMIHYSNNIIPPLEKKVRRKTDNILYSELKDYTNVHQNRIRYLHSLERMHCILPIF